MAAEPVGMGRRRVHFRPRVLDAYLFRSTLVDGRVGLVETATDQLGKW